MDNTAAFLVTMLTRSSNSTNLQALCHDVIVLWYVIHVEALKPDFVRLKCHGSLPEPSYSPELSSPSWTRKDQINQTAHMVAKAVYPKANWDLSAPSTLDRL